MERKHNSSLTANAKALRKKRSLLVVRIPNNAVNENFDGVCEYIDDLVKQRAD